MRLRVLPLLLALFLGLVSAVGMAGGKFPGLIQLPGDFGPEGIAVGNGSTFYVGSINATTAGQVLVGDLRTGEYRQLVAPTGTPALGMKYDSRSGLLFVAGGGSGTGTVYDAASGDVVASYQFQPASATTINDVVLTRDAAYFTDSNLRFLYKVALGPRGQPAASFTQVALPANFGSPGACTVGPALTGNGIAATPNGKYLVIVHMSEGALYRVDTSTEEVEAIDLGGGDVCAADGLLLDGKTLYAVQNFLNRVAVVELAPDYLSGTVERYITEPFASDPAAQVPTTIAEFGNSLYAVTAGFAPPSPDFVVRLSK